MLDKSFNAVVHYTLASSPEEIHDVFAGLPEAVVSRLAAELDVAGDVYRYDAEAHRAYYFERQGFTNLAVWSWNEVHRFHEVGELITLVVSSSLPLDEIQANKFYARATGRSVDHPRAVPSPNPGSD